MITANAAPEPMRELVKASWYTKMLPLLVLLAGPPLVMI